MYFLGHFCTYKLHVFLAYHLQCKALDRRVYQLIDAFFAWRHIGLLHGYNIDNGFRYI